MNHVIPLSDILDFCTAHCFLTFTFFFTINIIDMSKQPLTLVRYGNRLIRV